MNTATYDTSCSWYFQHPKSPEPFMIAESLTACDYPIRSINTKNQIVTMPVAGIPDFDQKDTTLILQCKLSSTTLKKAKYSCDKESTEYDHKARDYFSFGAPWYVGPKSEKSYVLEIAIWTVELIQMGIYGASPCTSAFLDLLDLTYYALAEVMDFNSTGMWHALQLTNFAL